MTITYNSVNPFIGQPIPFLGRVKDNAFPGERWSSEETWTLSGQLIACTYEDLVAAQTALINSFSEDFKDLVVIQGVEIARLSLVRVVSIVFPSTNFF